MDNSKTSKKIIVAMLVSILIYVGIAVFTQVKAGVEISPTLTICFFSVMGLEFTQLAGIKKAKVRGGIPTNLSDFIKTISEEIQEDESDEEEIYYEDGDI